MQEHLLHILDKSDFKKKNQLPVKCSLECSHALYIVAKLCSHQLMILNFLFFCYREQLTDNFGLMAL